MSLLFDLILLAAAVWASVTDIRQRRISNRLTFGVAALALALRLALEGPRGLLAGAEGWALGLALLLIPFMCGWMGAGDVKLLAAFGALGGPEFVLRCAMLGCLAGGVLAVVCLVRERKLLFFFKHFFIYLLHPLGSVLDSRRSMPFGPALAAGAVAGLVLTRGAL